MNTLREDPNSNSLKTTAAFSIFTVAGAVAMLWLAIYNGFPPLYYDSAGYIHDWTQHIRPIGYNVFIRLTSFGISLWFTVLVQAFITSYLLMRTSIIILGKNSLTTSFAAIVVLFSLVVLTSVSKYVSWLMPDILTSWTFFAIFLFLMGPALYDRLTALGVLLLSFFSHLSHVPLVIAFLAVIATANICSPRIRQAIGWSRLIKLVIVSVGIVFLICTINYFRIGQFALSYAKSGNFMVSHMISWGVVQKVLKEECAFRNWKLCSYQEELRAVEGKRHDWFLWNKNSPLRKVGGWEDQREQSEIARYAFQNHLGEIIKFAVRDGYRQWTTINGRSGFLPSKEIQQRGAGYNVYYLPIIKHYPQDEQRMAQSRQSQGTLTVNRIIPFPLNMAIGCALTLITIILLALKKQFTQLVFIGSAAVFVTLNAFVTGALAGVANRKQGKVAWILLYCVLTSIAAYILRRRERQQVVESNLI